MTNQFQHFADDKHAWASGILMGILSGANVDVSPKVDSRGNYTPIMDYREGDTPFTILIVPGFMTLGEAEAALVSITPQADA